MLGLVAAAPAGAATQIGQTLAPNTTCNAGFTNLQSNSPAGQYAVPAPGVITSWRFQANSAPPQLKLKLGRPVAGDVFTIVGESAVEAPAANQLNTYSGVSIPVRAGDVLGVHITSSGDCFEGPAPGYAIHYVSADPPPGTTMSFSQGSGVRIGISAMLEPDCDGDGLGDETQDSDLSPCPPPPETTITKGPKNKTKKKRATFEFTANEPGATFECSLDGDAFAPCASPETFKAKKGKHTFSVRAKDAGNNVEGSPATDDWKLKKKRNR